MFLQSWATKRCDIQGYFQIQKNNFKDISSNIETLSHNSAQISSTWDLQTSGGAWCHKVNTRCKHDDISKQKADKTQNHATHQHRNLHPDQNRPRNICANNNNKNNLNTNKLNKSKRADHQQQYLQDQMPRPCFTSKQHDPFPPTAGEVPGLGSITFPQHMYYTKPKDYDSRTSPKTSLTTFRGIKKKRGQQKRKIHGVHLKRNISPLPCSHRFQNNHMFPIPIQ
ncbi:hypothetical protein HYALB_00003089 [Hymenoscyphus albidus]|uniref:Uncharacterized protein n=1 Tax=Hymenoscyphus albidus TaxID=595503 RepID=A0A9N9M1S5_9HELO|nr:hypothetical protein HYALB_00003089 [Hymenoscyphus albidus]